MEPLKENTRFLHQYINNVKADTICLCSFSFVHVHKNLLRNISVLLINAHSTDFCLKLILD